ncbi:MAG: hypothetical protein FWG58_03480 [Methanomassiliicoccaceae archaeon]|nr:hypothetical protein [Methanomassiliicoccaceae archaeon]
MRDPDHMRRKVDSFLCDPNAGTLTGERRMGSGPLLDAVANRIISDDPEANIIRIYGTDDIGLIRSVTKDKKENHILVYCIIDNKELNDIMRTFPNAHVYRAQELCHQLPACVRES